MNTGRRARAALLTFVLVVGLGLAAAPLAFSMFDRAPKGGDMIDAFRPYMTRAEIAKLQGFLREIGAASSEAQQRVDPAALTRLGIDAGAYRSRVPYLAAFERQWPGIDADMTDMLDRMQSNLGNFAAVDALPPFPLFPWFFVLPGLAIAGTAAWALWAERRGRSSRRAAIALVILGVAVVAAPAVFQMFSRAPDGERMIDDFRPLMTRHKVTTVQGYFITIANGDADLRTQALPAAALPAGSTPAIDRFVADWPRINSEMAPVVGVMSDNVDNFAAVDALPPFGLFPWFFVVPGVLVALGGALVSRSRPRPVTSATTPSSDPRERELVT